MPRNQPQLEELMRPILDDHGELSLEAKADYLHQIRNHAPDAARHADLMLLKHAERREALIRDMTRSLKNSQELLEKLTCVPHVPALVVATLAGEVPRAIVCQNSARMVVGLAKDLNAEDLHCGDAVLLTRELNCILAKCELRLSPAAETATFDRLCGPHEAILKFRDEELVVTLAQGLRNEALRAGDLLRIDRSALLAFEKLDRAKNSELALAKAPRIRFEDIGGLPHVIVHLRRICDLFHQPELAQKYNLRRQRGILFSGPSGVGKTMLAAAICNYLHDQKGGPPPLCIVVKPSELASMWVGKSEENVRALFATAREACRAGGPLQIVCIFFDEIDATGSARGQVMHNVHDSMLMALMAEIDGLQEKDGNIIVIGATNRPEALDPGLVRPGRLGEAIPVPRPNRAAAREIFMRHLTPDAPYARNGCGDDMKATREHLIEAALTAIYAPNAQNEIAALTLRDGRQQVIHAADLMSGAIIAQVAAKAGERACFRMLDGQHGGITQQDVLSAIQEEFARLAAYLHPQNARLYLSNLPQDMDVTRVEPLAGRRVREPHRYFNSHAHTETAAHA